jgi:hypothetical protein
MNQIPFNAEAQSKRRNAEKLRFGWVFWAERARPGRSNADISGAFKKFMTLMFSNLLRPRMGPLREPLRSPRLRVGSTSLLQKSS